MSNRQRARALKRLKPIQTVKSAHVLTAKGHRALKRVSTAYERSTTPNAKGTEPLKHSAAELHLRNKTESPNRQRAQTFKTAAGN